MSAPPHLFGRFGAETVNGVVRLKNFVNFVVHDALEEEPVAISVFDTLG
jgi:hypothetical protein